LGKGAPVDEKESRGCPDDPVEILRVLPSRFHEQFLAEYDAVVTGARRPEHYRELHHLLRLWRLRAAAYSDPGYEARHQAVQDAVRAGRHDGTPIEDVVPDWAKRVAGAGAAVRGELCVTASLARPAAAQAQTARGRPAIRGSVPLSSLGLARRWPPGQVG
jgi:hypothetical protein